MYLSTFRLLGEVAEGLIRQISTNVRCLSFRLAQIIRVAIVKREITAAMAGDWEFPRTLPKLLQTPKVHLENLGLPCVLFSMQPLVASSRTAICSGNHWYCEIKDSKSGSIWQHWEH